ncbi:MAG: bifunctional homocysteine S-methyltransferase/methylenetetrahydrofolate reductase [Fimbriimonadales bacterium]|nr:MAG: bifunctional homocysteine S-methyltransferase/methylenetetrahydrofolate reductase [Fimbriimonadales bacterium]
MSWLARAREKVLIADGAIGTRLRQIGWDDRLPPLANLEAPDLVRQVHEEYRDAGCDIIETNTYGISRYRLPTIVNDRELGALALAGAQLARAACPDRVVLGAVGPCGKPLVPMGLVEREEAQREFRVLVESLLEGGVDGFVLESFADLSELEAAVEVVRELCDKPIVASKAFIEDGQTLAEGYPLEVARKLIALGVDAIGANCVVGPQRMFEIVRWMSQAGETPIFAMPTPGLPQTVGKQVVYDTTPEYFGQAAARLVEAGANVVGGCCGIGPEHIRALREAIGERAPKPRTVVSVSERVEKEALPESEPSELSRKLGQKFVITVELDLPRGLDTSRVLEGARALKAKGADMIDISDGARARLRMAPLAVCYLIQREAGIETMMHVACRDRNLLALQADLLGAHALGIRNVLPITGDPASIGDFPAATSVFDIDSVGLVRVLHRFNQGFDLAGNTVRRKCAFTIAVAFNPAAQAFEREVDRLKAKIDAGAHLIYTQPLFEDKHVERAVAVAREVQRPILIGCLPLRNARHAEFMHNEVPGIEIPEWVRKRMHEVGEEEGPEVGIEIAQEFCRKLPGVADGVYLMPPFGRHEVAERVMEAVL